MADSCPPHICGPSPSYSITIRVEIENRIGMFARIATAIGSAGGDMGAVDIVRVEKGKIIRDITANARDEEHEKAIVRAIRTVAGVTCKAPSRRTSTIVCSRSSRAWSANCPGARTPALRRTIRSNAIWASAASSVWNFCCVSNRRSGFAFQTP